MACDKCGSTCIDDICVRSRLPEEHCDGIIRRVPPAPGFAIATRCGAFGAYTYHATRNGKKTFCGLTVQDFEFENWVIESAESIASVSCKSCKKKAKKFL
jgi:hypothetical protein